MSPQSTDYAYNGGDYVLACKNFKDASEYAAEHGWRLAQWKWVEALHDDVIVFTRKLDHWYDR